MNGKGAVQPCPQCGFSQPVGLAECGRCGVVFSKRDARSAPATRDRSRTHRKGPAIGDEGSIRTRMGEIRDRLLTIPSDVRALELGGRGVVWLVVLILSWSYITSPLEGSRVDPSFVHSILSMADLVFHEAGHVVFSPFGSFLGTLGGSLLQLLVPGICVLTFLRYSNPFGASVALWWTGQSFINLAPYVYDARAQRLILLGGVTSRDVPGYHDWHNILSRLQLLDWDHTLGRLTQLAGVAVIALALTWGGYLLYLQYAALRHKS